MIQLKRNRSGNYELSDKKTTVSLSQESVRIGDQNFDSTGEYETDNVALIYGESGCLLILGQLQIVYLFKNDPPTSFEKDQFSASNILLIDHSIPEINKEVFEQLMGAYDPNQVVISNSTAIEATSKESLQIEEVSSLKLQPAAATNGGRDFYKLS